MVKPVFRRKSIGTKVSEEEYARLEALAGGRALGEWVREVDGRVAHAFLGGILLNLTLRRRANDNTPA